MIPKRGLQLRDAALVDDLGSEQGVRFTNPERCHSRGGLGHFQSRIKPCRLELYSGWRRFARAVGRNRFAVADQ